LKHLSWAILLILPSALFAAEVYRTVDADGHVIFTDRPSDNQNAELIEVETSAPPAPAAGQDQGDDDAADDRSGSVNQSLGAEVPRPATAEEIAKERRANCERAKQIAETYQSARRLYRDLGNDEREYLSSEEIDQARAEADQNVAIWCD
jgi:hypothetical protein